MDLLLVERASGSIRLDGSRRRGDWNGVESVVPFQFPVEVHVLLYAPSWKIRVAIQITAWNRDPITITNHLSLLDVPRNDWATSDVVIVGIAE